MTGVAALNRNEQQVLDAMKGRSELAREYVVVRLRMVPYVQDANARAHMLERAADVMLGGWLQ